MTDDDPRVVEVPMRPVKVKALCPHCREGELEYSEGAVVNINFPMFPHKCNACGHEQHVAGKKFPYLEFKSLD
jgi:uncharacterized protein (DUF983 family)